MRNGLTAALFRSLLLIAVGTAHAHSKVPHAAPGDPPITIVINPEARVSVGLGGRLPLPSHCGHPAELRIRIINQGFVTARLEARLVDDVPPGITLDFHPAPLTGMPEELRVLRITLTEPDLVDLTIAFRTHNGTPDLGGRDRVHFLMRCLKR